jgi:hypothetical protein
VAVNLQLRRLTLHNSRMVGKQEVIRFLSVCPLLKRKRDEACYRCTMPGFGLGQVEMSIASMSDRPRQPDWNGNKKER